MTMQEHEWTDRLSDYLDGELVDQEQRAVAAHVAECADCARTLEQLRAVVQQARAIGPVEPAHELWSGIAERIAASEPVRPIVGSFGARRRLTFTWPQLIAASLLLALVSGWATLRVIGPRAGTSANLQVRPDAAQPATAAVERRDSPDVVPASLEDQEYDAAVADLQRALQSGRGQLDPATIAAVEQNLAIIDQAVDEARRALAQDPANADLGGYLVETRRRQLDLLRLAAALTDDLN